MLRARRTSHNVSSRRLQSAKRRQIEAPAKEHLAPLPGAGFRVPASGRREGRQSAGESNESCGDRGARRAAPRFLVHSSLARILVPFLAAPRFLVELVSNDV
jgi:hypothetical protein